MLTSASYLDTQFDYCQKIANEVFKYEVLMKKKVKLNYQNQKNLKHAYQELAKTFYLADATSGYKLLQHLEKFCLGLICMKIRNDAYQGDYGVLSTCPSWVQALDKPFCLMQIVFKQLRKSRKPKATLLFSFELVAAVKRALDYSACELRPVSIFKRHSVQSFALSLELPVKIIFNLWKKMYKVSIMKLEYLLEAGDVTDNIHKSLHLTRAEKKIIDLGLLYDMKIRVVKKTSFLINEKLNVMILLYKLMVAARETYFSYVKQKNGARTGAATICQSSGNVNENNNANLNVNENYSTENEGYIKSSIKSSETLEMWALVYLEYSRRFDASFVLLQKRWYEIKSFTRKLLHWSTKSKNQIPHLLLIAIAKRLPYILAEDLPHWYELVKNGKVYSDSDISALPEEWKQMRLDVKENINVNDILEELYEENQDDVQVIESNIDVIDVDSDTDSEINDYSDIDYSNECLNKDTTIPKVLQDNITESQIERTLAPQKLGSADNLNIKTKIILEDDFDIDKELRIFEMKQKNSALTDNALGNEFSADDTGIIQNIDTEMDDTLDVNVSDDSEDDIPLFGLKGNGCSSNRNFVKQPPSKDLNNIEQNIENCKETEESIIDEKLIQLPQVVLTPVDKTSLWQKFSCDNAIQCRSFNTKKISDPNEIDKFSESRPAEPKMAESNEISSPNTEAQDKNTRKKIQNKRKFLMRHLKLSKTSYSKEFWSERNIKLLEQCKPVSVFVPLRVAKKVELPDIDEIRRINKTILTAQVAPMTHAHTNERTENSSIERVQHSNAQEEKNKNSKEIFNFSQLNNNTSNSETNPVMVNEEVNKMFKQIVVKKCTSNPINKINYKKPTTEADIKWLNNNINKQICRILDILVDRDCKIAMIQKKPRNMKRDGKVVDKDDLKEDLAFNSIDEWQRQKNYTRKYFHIKPVSNPINEENNKDDCNNVNKQISTEINQYGSDDSNLVIDEDVKSETKATNKLDKPLNGVANLDFSIKNEINQISNGVNQINKETNNEINKISNGVIQINKETNNEINKINNGISLNNEMIERNNRKTDINNDMSLNNEVNESDIEYIPNNNDMDLIIISSDDDDDVKPNINDTTKLNENVIKNRNNGSPVPKLVKILPRPSQNLTVDVNNRDVINMLSKVAYNIKSKNENVQSNLPTKIISPPPLKLIGNAKSPNKITNDKPLRQQPLNQNTTYYLIKVPSEMTPSNSFPMPVIQSVESLSSEQKVVITKTKQTQSPIVYNDLLKNNENPESLPSEQKVVITKTKQTQSPIVYNDLLKNNENPESLPSLLNNANIVNKVSLKRTFPVSLNVVKRLKSNTPLIYKSKEKRQRNTEQIKREYN